MMRFRHLVPLLAFSFVFNFAATAFADGGTWTPTGSLSEARTEHTATLLQNGKVLLAGGENGQGLLSSAELYDPATGTWTYTGSMNAMRFRHTATLLPNGKVLVVGGIVIRSDGSSDVTASAKLYDPSTGAWTPTGSMNAARNGHSATLLQDGKVLVAGGNNHDGWEGWNDLSSAEIYDPATGTWTPTGSMNAARSSHTATLLQNGKVLVAGGVVMFSNGGWSAGYSAEIYDPATGTWTPTGSMSGARSGHSATLLQDGKVLVAGECPMWSCDTFTAELYDSSTGTWSLTGSLSTVLEAPSATLLQDGKVLVEGGSDEVSTVNSAELYDPSTGTWTPTGSMSGARVSQTATLLQNGKVLVAGGRGRWAWASQAELYTPDSSNNPPVIAPIGDQTIHEGQPLSFTVSATDPDAGQMVMLSASGLPAGASFDPSTGAFSWTPDYSQAGTYTAHFTATDNGTPTMSTSEVVQITVNNVNRPPVIASIGEQTVNEGQTLTFTVNASDPEGDALTYSASNLPQGATFDSATHVFTWKPNYGQAGNYADVEFTVTDNGTPMQLADQMITITVGHVNRPPVFTQVGPQQVSTTIPLLFTVSAMDPDGDAVALSAANMPTGAAFNPNTGVFSWTPAYNQAGVYVVTFTATDNGSPAIAASSMDVVISVSETSPTTLTQNIIDTITASNLPKDQQNSYLANLQKVTIFINDGKISAAINQLNAFIQKLNQDYSHGKLTQAQYNAYLGQAQQIINDLQ
jgi:N-acetylneuraminic acid mutarotase